MRRAGSFAKLALLLVQERDQELWLAPFVARSWLKNGMTVSVENSPTAFGPVSYRIDSAVDRDVIEATVEPPMLRPPEHIVLRLRHPAGKPIQAVTIGGEPHADFHAKAETIRLAPGAGPFTLVVPVLNCPGCREHGRGEPLRASGNQPSGFLKQGTFHATHTTTSSPV